MIEGYSVSDHGDSEEKSVPIYTNELTFEQLQELWNRREKRLKESREKWRKKREEKEENK